MVQRNLDCLGNWTCLQCLSVSVKEKVCSWKQRKGCQMSLEGLSIVVCRQLSSSFHIRLHPEALIMCLQCTRAEMVHMRCAALGLAKAQLVLEHRMAYLSTLKTVVREGGGFREMLQKQKKKKNRRSWKLHHTGKDLLWKGFGVHLVRVSLIIKLGELLSIAEAKQLRLDMEYHLLTITSDL